MSNLLCSYHILSGAGSGLYLLHLILIRMAKAAAIASRIRRVKMMYGLFAGAISSMVITERPFCTTQNARIQKRKAGVIYFIINL